MLAHEVHNDVVGVQPCCGGQRWGAGGGMQAWQQARGCCLVTGLRSDFASTSGRVPVAPCSATNPSLLPAWASRIDAIWLTRGKCDALAAGGKVALHVAAESVNEGLKARRRAGQRRRHAPCGGGSLGRSKARRSSEHGSTAFERGHERVPATAWSAFTSAIPARVMGRHPQQIDGHSAALLQDRAPRVGASATRVARDTSQDGLPGQWQRPVGGHRRGRGRYGCHDLDAFPVALRVAVRG